MVLSPCSKCIFKNFPKDRCIKKCKTIQSVQKQHNIHISTTDSDKDEHYSDYSVNLRLSPKMDGLRSYVRGY